MLLPQFWGACLNPYIAFFNLQRQSPFGLNSFGGQTHTSPDIAACKKAVLTSPRVIPQFRDIAMHSNNLIVTNEGVEANRLSSSFFSTVDLVSKTGHPGNPRGRTKSET